MPTFIAYKDGKKIGEVTGAVPAKLTVSARLCEIRGIYDANVVLGSGRTGCLVCLDLNIALGDKGYDSQRASCIHRAMRSELRSVEGCRVWIMRLKRGSNAQRDYSVRGIRGCSRYLSSR
jgi:hypothetical protein